MSINKKGDIEHLLTHTASLMNHIYWVQQDFKLLPIKDHFATSINYVDLQEYRDEFIEELVNTVCEWVFSSKKAKKIIEDMISVENRSEQNANTKLRSLAFGKFRHRDDREINLQGQFGELLLFNFIQHFYQAVPIIRKMPLTTSAGHERFGADAIHYKAVGEKKYFILGESKAYTSDYKFQTAFEASIKSIVSTFTSHRKEIFLYLYDDFLDESLIEVAKAYKNGTITNAEVHLVCLIAYNETHRLTKKSEQQIKKDIVAIVEDRCKALDKEIMKNIESGLLSRINYIIFPIWDFEELLKTFQNMVGQQ